jgi:hypothetical protein
MNTDPIMSSLPTVRDLLGRMASPSALTAPVAVTTSGGGAPWTADSVEDPVEVLDQAPLRYPPALAGRHPRQGGSGICGGHFWTG